MDMKVQLAALFYFFTFLLIDFAEREKYRFVVSLTYASIGWFLYVPQLRTAPQLWHIWVTP